MTTSLTSPRGGGIEGGEVDEALRLLDNMPPWIVARGLPQTRRRRHPWLPAEIAEIKAWWGKIPRPDLAARITTILRQETGDPTAERSVDSLANYARELGLTAYIGEPDEIGVRAAARQVGVRYEILWEATVHGILPSAKKGKGRYISRRALANWYVAFRERQIAQSELLEALENEDIISKREAMALSGYGETHLTRYLITGIIRAWKIPSLGLEGDGRGEWAVDRRSLNEFIQARLEGRLGELLDQNPAYLEIRQKGNAELKALRRAGRLGKPDPLTEPKSRYHPGCFTVVQVASHVGLSCATIYSNIEHGWLTAVSIVAGGRPRLAIEPAEAHRYVAWLKEGPNKTSEWYSRRRQQIAQAGLLTTNDVAKRFSVTPESVTRWVKHGGPGGIKLKSHRFGHHYLVYRPEDVEEFGQSLLAARQNNLTVSEVAQLMNVTTITVRNWAIRGRKGVILPSHIKGRRYRLFTLANIEEFARKTGIKEKNQ